MATVSPSPPAQEAPAGRAQTQLDPPARPTGWAIRPKSWRLGSSSKRGHPGESRLSRPGPRRAADAPDGPGCLWEGLLGRILQLRLPLHGGALPHRHPVRSGAGAAGGERVAVTRRAAPSGPRPGVSPQADGHGAGQHHGPAGQHHGPPGEDGGRGLPRAAPRHLWGGPRGVGAGGPVPAGDAGHGAARDRGGGGGQVGGVTSGHRVGMGGHEVGTRSHGVSELVGGHGVGTGGHGVGTSGHGVGMGGRGQSAGGGDRGQGGLGGVQQWADGQMGGEKKRGTAGG